MISTAVSGALAIPDLTDPRTFVDGVPFRAFDEIRSRPGLYWQPAEQGTVHGGFWVLTKTKDCLAVERDPALFTSTRGSAWPWTNLPPDHPIKDSLLQMDPPRHSSVRRVVAKAFGPRVVANFDPWVRAIVTDALDAMVATTGPFNYVQMAAVPIPSRVVGRVMGIPLVDEHVIVESTTEVFAAAQLTASQGGDERLAAAYARLFGYVSDVLIPLKRRAPADDMCSVLTQSMDSGELSVAECLNFHQLLTNAGFETTHTLIGQSMRMMLEDPEIEQMTFRAISEVGADRVVDEFLRFITPAMFFSRMATRDTELSGQVIRADDVVSMYFIAANRDPETFSDPHRFNPWRQETGSLVFGSAHHRCIGSALAKLELAILFEEMAKRNIRLRLAGTPRRGWSYFVNQLTDLPVVVESGA